MKRALKSDELMGDEHERTAWMPSRRWSAEAREAQRARMIVRRPWLRSHRDPEPFARAELPALAVSVALAAFLPPVDDAPLPHGVAFALPRR